ncbi:type I HSP40 co-chaperone HLJ1 [Lachancea thermotolerans CBS 6340]|uniref:KLTH0F09944p n=1 Tax=Lachancea thermotolerans (strain ATCC 56472 / CBS 6340 / NRRL Y-8284) TaxID=559295 RepID=C5DL48_LACTC|nr:KLTH0F09944p [Lachancea thermotolerans CBS 6340]CAR24199.1 KLTH0F09944p [Lachancea thermotolerans CBS 6340]
MAEYTKEQEELTLFILGKDKHAFYEVLQIEREASDNEIKKAYRKLAIKLHPDKNKHPRASEAFKRINRAFEVLSDEQKRRIFDQVGHDPDERPVRDPFASGRSTATAGFPPENMFFRRAPGGQPQDIFDFLFNAGAAGGGHPFNSGFGGPFGGPFQGGFGGPFGGGGATTFTFGGPNGFKVYTNGTPRARGAPRGTQQQEQEDQREAQQILRILVPILFILFLPMLERLLFGS